MSRLFYPSDNGDVVSRAAVVFRDENAEIESTPATGMFVTYE